MTCDLILEWMDDYFEDQLDEQNREKFEQHLKTCSDCRMLVEDFKSMKEVMFEMPLMALPNDFNESLHEKLLVAAEEINANKKARKKVIAFPVNMKKTFQYVGAAAAIVIVAASATQLKDSFWWNQSSNEQAAYELKNAGGPAEVPPMTMDTSTSNAVLPETAAAVPSTAPAPGSDGAAAQSPSLMKTAAPNAAETGRMLIRSGDITLEVANYEAFYKQIEALTTESGGYIESSYSGKSPFYENNKLVGSQLSGSVVLRIPSEKFKTVFEQVKTLGILQASQQNVQDVTTQITDLTASVENLKVRENRLRELMKQAKNVAEVMTVEQELSNVRTQIDQLEAQLRQQKNQVSLSTLYVNVQERPEIGGQFQTLDGNLFERAKQAFVKNINIGIQWFEAAVVTFVAWSPVILVAGLFALGFTKTQYFKKWRNRK